jgi:hypothetical protein
MSESSEDSTASLTAAQVEEWIQSTTMKYLQLYLEAVAPSNNPKPEVSLAKMALLFQEAIGKVQVMSDLLWGNSPAVVDGATEARAHATRLRKKLISLLYR